MKLSSANILRSGKREIRAIGDVCDLACFVGFSCSNSVPDGVCKGFSLMNHQTRTHLNKMLNADDNKYIENCVNTIQRGCDEETRESLVSEVLRYLPPKEPERKEGFIGMVEASRRFSNTPTEETEPIERAHDTGFLGMLDALTSKTESHPTLTRAIDESQFPPLCNPMSCPPDYARHCSANRPENYGRPCIYKTLTNEEIKHPETQQRIAKSATLPELLDRLETLEKAVLDAENSATNEHIIQNRPNFCKTKNPNGVDDR